MLRTYDPKRVIISLGSHIVSGYSDGTFVNIEPNGDGVSAKTGCDGEKIRSIDPDDSVTITITVLQNSPSVGFCQQQYDMDRTTGNGEFPVTIRDLRGGLIVQTRHAWVVNSPSREFGKETSDRELVIETGHATQRGEPVR